MRTLARLIREAGIHKHFFLYGRSDTIARHPDLIAAWKEIGLDEVFVGLEFFRDEDLRYVGKGSTISDNEAAIKVLQDLDIAVYASLMVRPEFTHADFAGMRAYCRDLRLSFATFAVLTPLPGTDLYEEERGRLLTDNWDYYDFIHTLLPTSLPLPEFYAELAGLYRSAIPFSQRAGLIKRYRPRYLVHNLQVLRGFLRQVEAAPQDYAAVDA